MITQPSCAQALVRMLENLGVRYVFGIPGAKIDSVFEAIVASEKIQLVLCRHEQNATFMAAAMGRMTGRVGVVLATSGPGVGNLATGLATATAEGDPVLAIGGEVPLEERVKSTHQSIDSIALLRPATKYVSEITTPTQLGELLGEAVRTAESGRPGAAFLSLPRCTHRFFSGLAVFADSLNALAVGAPGVPGFLIFSLLPAAMRSCLALILLYKPGLVAMI